MKKIKDRIVLGAAAGLIAGQFGKIVMGQIHKKSHDYRFRAAASLFLPHQEVKASTIESRIISTIVNNVVSGVSGVIISYVYSFTGKDFALLKGAGIGVLQWIGMYGLLSKLRVTIKSNDPVVHIISSIDHTVFGVLTGWLITKLGDDSVFPDRKKIKPIRTIKLTRPSSQPPRE